MTVASLGYPVPAKGAVRVRSWMVDLGQGRVAPLAELTPDWDYFASLELTAEFEVDLEDFREAAGLGADAVVAGSIGWSATATRMRGATPPVPIVEGVNVLTASLLSAELGGALQLELQVVLINRGDGASPVAARRVGSILWRERVKTWLEGDTTRFPTAGLSFSDAGVAAGRQGLWALEVGDSDLGASAGGSLRVLLNTDHPRVQHMLADPDSASATALAKFMRYDVARQMMDLALSLAEFEISDDYPVGSVGSVLSGLLGGMASSKGELVARASVSRSELEAEFQAISGLMGDE